MKCFEFLTQLDELVDGKLSGQEMVRANRHVESCEACRLELRELQELLAAAAELPHSIEPPRDLWPGIAARLDVDAGVVPFEPSRRSTALRWWMAAAAVLAVAAVTAVLTLAPGSAPMTVDDGLAGIDRGEPIAVHASTTGDLELGRVRRELVAVLKVRQHELSPATLETVMSNLEIIDDAVAKIDQALAAEPGNYELHRLRLAVYQREISLLKQVARMPADA